MIESLSSAAVDRASSHPTDDATACMYLLRYRDGTTVPVDRNTRLTDEQLDALHSSRADLVGRASDGSTVVVWTESEFQPEGAQ